MKKILLILFTFLSFMYSCSKDNGIGLENGSNNTTDVAVTGGTIEVGASMADFYGYVNLNLITAQYNKLEIGIEYSLDRNFSHSKVEKINNSAISSNRFEVSIDGSSGRLTADTTYFYRTSVAVYSSNSQYKPVVTYNGKTATFKTKNFSNIATISGVNNITMSSAEFSVEIDSTKIPKFKGKNEYIDVYVYYSKNNKDYKMQAVSNWDYTSGERLKTPVAKINDLEPNQTYYYYVGTMLYEKVKHGDTKSFKTGSFQSSYITTGDANPSFTSALLTCSSTVLGSVSEYGICLSKNKADVQSQSSVRRANNQESGKYSLELRNLVVNQTYYYCAYFILNNKYYFGEIKSFATLDPSEYIKTLEAKDISYNNATICGLSTIGDVYSSGYYVLFQYSENKSDLESGYGKPTYFHYTNGSQSFSYSLNNLSAETTYYYRAVIEISNIYYYGEIKSFTTDSEKSDAEVKLVEILSISDGFSVDYQFNAEAYSFRLLCITENNEHYNDSDDKLIDYIESSSAISNVSEYKNNNYYTSWSNQSANTNYLICVLAYDSYGTRGKLNKYKIKTPSATNQPIAALGTWNYESVFWKIDVTRNSNCKSYYYLCYSGSNVNRKLSPISAAHYIKNNYIDNFDSSHLITEQSLNFSSSSSLSPIVVATWGLGNDGKMSGVVTVKGNNYYNANYPAKKRTASKERKLLMTNTSDKEFKNNCFIIKR